MCPSKDSLVCWLHSFNLQYGLLDLRLFQSTVWFVYLRLQSVRTMSINYCLVCCPQSISIQSGLFTPVYQSTASLPIDSLVCWPQSTNLQSGLLSSVCQSTAWIFDQSAVCFLNRIYQFTVCFLISVYRSAACFAYYYSIITVCL